MFNDFVLSNYAFDRLPKTFVTIKTPAGVSYDNTTNRQVATYTETQTYAYVGTWDVKTLQALSTTSNKITSTTLKVIVRGVDVSTDSIIVIDGNEYKVAFLRKRGNLTILGVNPS